MPGPTPPTSITPAAKGDPRTVGPYRIIGRIGAGGMGVVHAGLAPDGTRVAVKVIRAELAGDSQFRERFRREVELLRRTTGPFLVPLLNADADAATPWLATAYVPGPTLAEHIATHGPLTGGALFGFAAGAAQALVSVHSAGVTHRDLKPGNVILGPYGPRVLDFGIAHALDETSLTRTGMWTGSAGWSSPEQYRGKRVGPQGDVFAWGALVAYAATGTLPFGTGAPDAVAFRILQENPDLTGVPESLRPLVADALAKEPEERPTAEELLRRSAPLWGTGATVVGTAGPQHEAPTVAAAPVVAGQVPHPMPPMPPVLPTTTVAEDPAWERARLDARKRRLTLLGAAGTAVVLLAAGGGYLAGRGSSVPAQSSPPQPGVTTVIEKTVEAGVRSEASEPSKVTGGEPVSADDDVRYVLDGRPADKPVAEVRVGTCKEPVGDFELFECEVTVKSLLDRRASFSVYVEALDSSGNRTDESMPTVSDLGPGSTAKDRALFSRDKGASPKDSVKILKVDAYTP